MNPVCVRLLFVVLTALMLFFVITVLKSMRG